MAGSQMLRSPGANFPKIAWQLRFFLYALGRAFIRHSVGFFAKSNKLKFLACPLISIRLLSSMMTEQPLSLSSASPSPFLWLLLIYFRIFATYASVRLSAGYI
jgi:hypothetical protein